MFRGPGFIASRYCAGDALGAIISRFSFILGRESNMLRVRALSIKFKSVAPKTHSLTLACRATLHKVVNFGRLSGNRGKWKSQLGRIWNACRRSPAAAACCDCERCDVNVFCRLKWEIAQLGFYGPVNRTQTRSHFHAPWVLVLVKVTFFTWASTPLACFLNSQRGGKHFKSAFGGGIQKDSHFQKIYRQRKFPSFKSNHFIP